jgi:hypothetical protein
MIIRIYEDFDAFWWFWAAKNKPNPSTLLRTGLSFCVMRMDSRLRGNDKL